MLSVSRPPPAGSSSLARAVTTHPVLAYVILAFTITWLLVAPIAASAQGWIALRVSGDWHIIGAVGPIGAALLVAWASRGRRGVAHLLHPLRQWRLSPWLYAAALSPALALLPAAVITRWVDGAWPDLARLAVTPRLAGLGWLVAVLLPALAYGVGEETGWRGFALPRLQARFHPLVATLLLGIIWVLWHIPFYLYRAGMVGTTGAEQLAQAIIIVIGAIFLTWLYNSAGGSLLLPVLWHTTHSLVHLTLPLISSTWETYDGVLTTLLAIYIAVVWWRRLSTGTVYAIDEAGNPRPPTRPGQTATDPGLAHNRRNQPWRT